MSKIGLHDIFRRLFALAMGGTRNDRLCLEAAIRSHRSRKSAHYNRRSTPPRSPFPVEPMPILRTRNAPIATNLLICVILALAVATVFAQTVRFEFVNYDDIPYILANREVRSGLTLHGPNGPSLNSIRPFGLAVASCVVTVIAQAKAIKPLAHLPVSFRIAESCAATVSYLIQFFVPANLAAFCPEPVIGESAAIATGCATALALLTAAAILMRRRAPWLLVGWLWYLVMLVPVIGLVHVGEQAQADRYTYLPMIGPTVAIAYSAAAWTGRAARPWAAGAAAILLAALAAVGWQQAGIWRNSATLWEATLTRTDNNALACCNLGEARKEQGRADEALALYRKALAFDPDCFMARANLGGELVDRHQCADAARQLRQA